MAVIPRQVILQFGSSNTGQAANVQYKIVDSAGTVQVGLVAGGWTEIADYTDTALNTGAYSKIINFDTAWTYPVVVLGTIVNAATVSAPAVIEGTQATLNEIQGLIGLNQGLRDAVYSGTNLTSANLFLYDTAAHAATNDGATGVLHQYAIANTYDGGNNLITSITRRIS